MDMGIVTDVPEPITKTSRYQSWGRYPKIHNSFVEPLYWRDEVPDLSQYDRTVLPYALGRSYGDSCLNNDGIVLDTRAMNRFLAFDAETGILRCEAAVSIDDILKVVVPHGWFVPVTPGTKYVTIAGAIANDVHGKNHHSAGTFGCHVTQFELLRSDGSRLICSPTENVEMFKATIGGLGLTGLILWAEFKLKKIANPFIAMDAIRYDSLDEFWELDAESNGKYHYIASWIDVFTGGAHAGRGHYFRGNNATDEQAAGRTGREKLKLRLPIDVPSFLWNPLTVRILSEGVYRSLLQRRKSAIQYYEPFFYPLDGILDWNRGYGNAGFLQYQFVVPGNDNYSDIKTLLSEIRKAGTGSFLTVFKRFGEIKSPGMLSFPRPGLTLALDFAFKGESTLKFLDKLDNMVRDFGGAVYPAKDARMSAENFQAFFPEWVEFSKYIDPKFSSSFWRRVTGNVNKSTHAVSAPVLHGSPA